MKLLILSDIHANIYALQAIEQAEAWDEIYCCGDLVDYGPFPAEVIAWMQVHHAHVVLGNHDAYVLGLTPAACAAAREQKVWRWAHQNYEQLNADQLNYLAGLPVTLSFRADGVDYQMQHQYGPSYGTVETEEQFNDFWKASGAVDRPRCLLFGHTHRSGIHLLTDHERWLNPGSVSYRRPDDHDKRVHYIMIEDGIPRFGALHYDRTPLLEKTMEYFPDRMLKTDLQDAFFFFGDARTTRDEW